MALFSPQHSIEFATLAPSRKRQWTLQDLLRSLGSDDPRVDSFVDGVTGASGTLEPPHIQNRYLAAAIPNQFAALQRGCGAGHAYAANSQHQCEEFMREVKMVRLRTVPRHQKPPGQARVDAMKPRAR
jgi:hypothetical protein